VDVAVLEVGLGGRLDATNIVPVPAACGITPLGMDHMEILGHTLALISAEKAGILKRGVPAFTAPQQSEAMRVLEQRALAMQVRCAAPCRSCGLLPRPAATTRCYIAERLSALGATADGNAIERVRECGTGACGRTPEGQCRTGRGTVSGVGAACIQQRQAFR